MLRLPFFVTLAFLVGLTFAQYENQYYSDGDFQTQYYEEPGIYDHYAENYNQIHKSPLQTIADKFRNFVNYHGNGLRRQGVAAIIVPFLLPLLIGLAAAGGIIFVAQDAGQQRNALNDRLNAISSENSLFTGAIQMLTNRLAQSEARINALQAEINALEMENMGGEETTPGPDETTATESNDETTATEPSGETTATEPSGETTATEPSGEVIEAITADSTLLRMGRNARIDQIFWYQ